MDLYYLGKDSTLSSGLEKALDGTKFSFRRDLAYKPGPNKIQRNHSEIEYLVLIDTDTVDSFQVTQFKKHMNAGAYILFVASETYNPRASKVLRHGKKREEILLKELEEIAMPRSYKYRFGSLNLELIDYMGETSELKLKPVDLLQRDHSGKIMSEEEVNKAIQTFDERPNLIQYFTEGMRRVSVEAREQKLKGVTPLGIFRLAIEYALEEFKPIYEKWKEKNGANAYLGFIAKKLEETPFVTLENFSVPIPKNLNSIYLDKLLQAIGINERKPVKRAKEKEYKIEVVQFTKEDKLREDKTKALDEKIEGWHELYKAAYSKFSKAAKVSQDDRETRANRLLIYDFAIAVRNEEGKLIGMSYYSLNPNFEYRDCLDLRYPSIYHSHNTEAVMGSFMVDPNAKDKSHIINFLFEVFDVNLRIWNRHEDLDKSRNISAAVHPEAYPVRKLFFDRKFSKNEFFVFGFYEENKKIKKDFARDMASFNPVALMAMHDLMFMKYLQALESKYMQHREKYSIYELGNSNNKVNLQMAIKATELGEMTEEEFTEIHKRFDKVRMGLFDSKLDTLLSKMYSKKLPGEEIEKFTNLQEKLLGGDFFEPEIFDYLAKYDIPYTYLDFMVYANMGKDEFNDFLMMFLGKEIIREKLETIEHGFDLMFMERELREQQLELERLLDEE